MKQSSFVFRLLLGLALCMLLATPALAASAKADAKQPKAPAAAPDKATLENGLRQFASETIASINRCILPSEGKKEIVKNGDGTFTARYKAIDPRSVNVSVTPSSNPNGPVSHIGYMRYCENELACTAPTKDAAAKGPFLVMRTENLTELVKYLNGKWSY